MSKPISEAVAGSGLHMTGPGTLVLSAANTYTGSTTVNSGTLVLNGSIKSTGPGAMTTIGGSATLTGAGTVYGPVTLSGTLSPGNNDLTASMTTGALSIQSGSVLNYQLGRPGTSSQVNVAANLYGGTGLLTLPSGVITVNAASYRNTAAAGTYDLINYVSETGGTPTWTVNLPASLSTNSYTVTNNAALDQIDLTINPLQVSGTWTQTLGGAQSWPVTGNWLSGQVPGSNIGDQAFFPSALVASTTVALNKAVELTSLTVSATAPYTFVPGAGGSFTFVSSGSVTPTLNAGRAS